jgi:hypothetical protein
VAGSSIADDRRTYRPPTADSFPSVSAWGDGDRAFHGRGVRMRLVSATTFDSGVALLIYRPTIEHSAA